MNAPLPATAAGTLRSLAGAEPFAPVPYRVLHNRTELADTFTLSLEPADGHERLQFLPGQFNMVYLFGVGEVPISISSDPGDPGPLLHTIRAVGRITEGLRGLSPGDLLGLRGPFGTSWPVMEAAGSDLVFVVGGIGLAPLRPALYQALAHREKFGRIVLLYGARTPADILYRDELEQWRARFDLDVAVTVDRGDEIWMGDVGVVTKLVERAPFDPLHTRALVCGPEIMMRFAAKSLMDRGVAESEVFLSMERNMKCAVGFCGHCQLGGQFICKDGPVYSHDRIAPLMAVREL